MDTKVQGPSRSKAGVIAGLLAVVAAGVYFGLGMPGMDHGGSMSSMASMDHRPSSTPQTTVLSERPEVALLDPANFAARITGSAVLVNVHVPFEGNIEGTQISVPFDKIGRQQVSSLPANLDTPLLVYCRSGRMSAIAAAELVRLGYRNVSDLRGGMLAWENSGRSLVNTEPSKSAT